MGLFSLQDLEYMFYAALRNGSLGTLGAKGDPGGITLGTVVTGATDLNTILTDGIVRWGGAVPINAPNANTNYAVMYTNTTATGVLVQIVFTANTVNGGRSIHIRNRDGANFLPWRSYNSTRVDQTAGRAIYQYDDVNNRDQLIYGDTGWRQVVAVGENVTLPNLQAFIRRVGSTVTFHAYETTAAAAFTGAVNLYDIPEGFKFGLGASPAMVSGTVIDSGANPVANSAIYVASSATPSVILKAVSGVRHYTTISWSTVQAWPTVLPGSAHGTIPNL